MFRRCVITLLMCVLVVCVGSHDARELYDLDLPNSMVVKVSTSVKNLDTPMGIAVGRFNGKDGVFYSSYSSSDIWFFETSSSCEKSASCVVVKVAGTSIAGVADGTITTASFADPSRLLYMADLNILVVADRANGYMRYIMFDSNLVGTMKTSSGTKLQLLGNQVSDNNPELDVKRHGDYLYVSDTKYVYNITGDDGSIGRAFNYGVLKRYNALATWQSNMGYVSSQKVFVASIAVDSTRNQLYVSYTFARSAIVIMPLEVQSLDDIRILSSDGIHYTIPLTYPIPVNGKLTSEVAAEVAVITFPIHMYYDHTDDVLYWLEVYPTSVSASYAVGAVAVRRLQFSTGIIDYYAGDTETYRNGLGRITGYIDGPSNIARFKYPVSLAFHSSTGLEGLGPLMYVCDYGNGAIRRVSTVVETPNPTPFPTISLRPTGAPTVSHRPTSAPTRCPTVAPIAPPSHLPTIAPSSSAPTSSAPSVTPTSSAPTPQPSASFRPTLGLVPSSAPTELNGDCLQVLLLDEFGDGWGGLKFYANHSGWKSAAVMKTHIARSDDPDIITTTYSKVPTETENPVVFEICASLDEMRYHERGLYKLEIIPIPNQAVSCDWEVLWQVSTMSQNYNDVNTGGRHTRMDFEFTTDGVFERRRVERPLATPGECRRCDHPPPHPPSLQRHSAALPASQIYDGRKTEATEGPPPPKLHAIPFILHDTGGDGWFINELGTKFSITDGTKTKLLSSGTVCGDLMKEDCEVKLPDGDYYFRVGGAGDSKAAQVAWTFCNVHGKSNEELSFAILGGKCIPGHHRGASSLIGTVERTNLVMKGELLLDNVYSEELSLIDRTVFESAISTILQVDSSEVFLIDSCVTKPGRLCLSGDDDYTGNDDNDGGRRKSSSGGSDILNRELSTTYVLDISFVVTIIAEEYGVIGSIYHDLMDLFRRKKKLLDNSFNDKSLESAIRAEAQASKGSSLGFVHTQHIVPMKKMALHYGFDSVTAAPTPATDDKILSNAVKYVTIDESTQQESLVLVPLSLVILSVIVVYALVRRGNNQSELQSWEGASGDWREIVLSSKQDMENEKKASSPGENSRKDDYNGQVVDDDLHVLPIIQARYRHCEGVFTSESSRYVYDIKERVDRNAIYIGQSDEYSV